MKKKRRKLCGKCWCRIWEVDRRMNNEILCYACNKEIKSNNDLITRFYLFRIKPFHNACGIHVLKTWKGFLFGIFVINSKISTIISIIFPVFALIHLALMSLLSFAVFNFENFYIFIFLVYLPLISFMPTTRLYSYYKYEKPLK